MLWSCMVLKQYREPVFTELWPAAVESVEHVPGIELRLKGIADQRDLLRADQYDLLQGRMRDTAVSGRISEPNSHAFWGMVYHVQYGAQLEAPSLSLPLPPDLQASAAAMWTSKTRKTSSSRFHRRVRFFAYMRSNGLQIVVSS